MTSLVDKKVIVVGGSSGIGLGVAAAALGRGAQVVIVGRSQQKLQAAQRILHAGDRLTSIAADAANEPDVARILPRSAHSTISCRPPAPRLRGMQSATPISSLCGALSTTS